MIYYWTAISRGADFKELSAKGFRVFYPVLDDYVFLEVSDKNKVLLTKQDELRVKFLKDSKGKIMLVSEKDLGQMQATTQDPMVEGAEISVVDGYCSGLDGKVISREGSILECEVYGYKRVFSVALPAIQVVLRGIEPTIVLDGEGLVGLED